MMLLLDYGMHMVNILDTTPMLKCLDLSTPMLKCLDLSTPILNCLDLSTLMLKCLDQSIPPLLFRLDLVLPAYIV